MNKKVEVYITNHYYDLLGICKKYTSKDKFSMSESDYWAQELLHEVIMQLYDQKEYRGKTDNQSIKYYIVRIIMVNWCFETSPFFRKYKNPKHKFVDLKDIELYPDEQDAFNKEEIYELLEENYSELPWFHKSIMDMYIMLGSISKVSKQMKIPYTSAQNYINQAKRDIKLNIEEKLKNI